eukprot:gene11912-15154_t
MELERAPFELALCVEEALDLFALQASSKKLELTYHISSDVPAWIMGDVTRLRQVVVNLVNNAVKFTPSGSISLEIRRAVREQAPLGFEPGLALDPSRMILEHLRLMPPISDVAGADSFPVRKPDPRHILMLLERMGGDPKRAVMIGDSTHDAEAARGAGIPAVLVSWGYTARPASELGADAVIDRFDALPAALARLAAGR